MPSQNETVAARAGPMEAPGIASSLPVNSRSAWLSPDRNLLETLDHSAAAYGRAAPGSNSSSVFESWRRQEDARGAPAKRPGVGSACSAHADGANDNDHRREQERDAGIGR